VQGLATQNAVVLHKYPLWRDALTEIVKGLGFHVAGTTDSSDEALALVERENAALFVVGTTVGRGNESGIDCVRRARSTVPTVKAVVLAPTYDDAEVEHALAAGAFAYVVETTHPEDIRAAIRQGFQTSVFLGAGEAGSQPSPPARRTEGHEPLTKRELEILRLVSEGASNADVARKLWVTEQTVKFHLSNIYRKLGVANRTEAARWAQLTGLLEAPSAHESSASGS
jgi:DNA-binding NarL/FixJ family response regulator